MDRFRRSVEVHIELQKYGAYPPKKDLQGRSFLLGRPDGDGRIPYGPGELIFDFACFLKALAISH